MEVALRPRGEIVKEVNAIISRLVVRFEKKCRAETELANLERLRSRIRMLKEISEEEITKGAYPFFITYSDQILEPDVATREAFFTSIDPRKVYRERYNEEPTASQDFVFQLVDIIRNQYKVASQTEKTAVYTEVKNLHNACIEYKLACLAVK